MTNNSSQFVARVEVIGAPNHPYNHTIKVDYVPFKTKLINNKPWRTLHNY